MTQRVSSNPWLDVPTNVLVRSESAQSGPTQIVKVGKVTKLEISSQTYLGQETMRRIRGVGITKHLVLITRVNDNFACITQSGRNLLQYRLRTVRTCWHYCKFGVTLTVSHGARIV